MSRLAKILAVGTAVVSVAVITAACGTQHIAVPSSEAQLHRGAVVFNERCAGCHTLSAAATYGSAPNIRTAQDISGPALDQRCERPVDRVLYAIANGGFSGAYMPQNVVVGQDAVDVAKFVATYAGAQAEAGPGQPTCHSKPIGTLPAGSGTVHAGASSSAATPSTTSTSTAVAAAPSGKSKSSTTSKGKSSSKKSSGS